MPAFRCWLLSLLSVLCSLTSVVADEPAPPRFVIVDDNARQAADSSNRFAVDLYRQSRRAGENLFFSPTSISTALAMTYAGARADTEREMAAVLHLQAGQNTHAGFSTLYDLLNYQGEFYAMRIANRLWGQQGFRFQEAFLKLTREKYHAELTTVNFAQAEESRRVINQWIEEQTNRKIVNLIPSGVLDSDTRLVLTNAIYFDGKWMFEFPKNATTKAPFHVSAKDEISVPTMRLGQELKYAEDDDVQIVALPYRGNQLEMVIVLPRKQKGLAEVESGLTAGQLDGWIKSLKVGTSVAVQIPKFKMRSQLILSETLQSLGMKSAFTSNADFSGMSTSDRLQISEVVHQAYVAVDELGTEAAAATAVVVVRAMAPAPKPWVEFRADHPFLFLIRDQRTGAILFLGRFVHPEAA